MRLTADDGTTLTLQLESYEYPDLQVDPYGYDLNWLVAAVMVDGPRGTRQVRGAMLLTWEVQTLVRWLSDLASGKVRAAPSFTEPILSFALSRNDPDLLEVRLRDYSATERSEHLLRFPIRSKEISCAAEALASQARAFPERPASSH